MPISILFQTLLLQSWAVVYNIHRKMELATGTDIRDAQMLNLSSIDSYREMMRFASINQKVSAVAESTELMQQS